MNTETGVESSYISHSIARHELSHICCSIVEIIEKHDRPDLSAGLKEEHKWTISNTHPLDTIMQAPNAMTIKVVLPLAQLIRGQSRYAVPFSEDRLSRRAHV